MQNQNRNVFIISLVALVNMLGYGIIIPIIYDYSKKFGLTDFQNGVLFAVFSFCQFISTPIIGRLSDKYGRRPLLIGSITGTAISFIMMAFAPNALFLFLARGLDGLTAGNIPVAFAVISDTTKPEERAKAFGFIGAAFSFGFVFGPAISALTVDIWNPLPFLIAAAITILAIILAFFYLPETNTHLGEVSNEKLFDLHKLWKSLFDPAVGSTFLISLIFYLAFGCAILYGFQPFALKILKLTVSQNAMLFTLFGFVGLITQSFLVARIAKRFGNKNAFSAGLLFTAVSFIIMFLSQNVWMFVLASIILALFNSVVQTLIPAILSQEADAKSQGSIMGLNASYQSIGMIFGPLLGGVVASVNIANISPIPLTFLVGAVLVLLCFLLSFRVLSDKVPLEV